VLEQLHGQRHEQRIGTGRAEQTAELPGRGETGAGERRAHPGQVPGRQGDAGQRPGLGAEPPERRENAQGRLGLAAVASGRPRRGVRCRHAFADRADRARIAGGVGRAERREAGEERAHDPDEEGFLGAVAREDRRAGEARPLGNGFHRDPLIAVLFEQFGGCRQDRIVFHSMLDGHGSSYLVRCRQGWSLGRGTAGHPPFGGDGGLLPPGSSW
jgi:hypothetical protein